MPTTIRVGDSVTLYGSSYVRGTRRPGFRGRFRRVLLGGGVLLSKHDPAAHAHTPLEGKTPDELRAILGACLAFRNATGNTVAGDITAKNNPVRLDTGRVVWADAANVEAAR